MAQIMLAAREAFAEKGYTDTAVTEIAARVGVVEGAVYRFFDSKRDLLMQVIAHWYEEVLKQFESTLAQMSGTRARLRFVVWHNLMCIHNDPELVNLFYGLIRLERDYPGSRVYELNRRYMGWVMRILKEAMDNGELSGATPLRLVRDMIYGTIEYQTWPYRMRRGELDIDAVADQITDAVLAAYAPRDEAQRGGQLAAISGELDGIAQRLAALAQ